MPRYRFPGLLPRFDRDQRPIFGRLSRGSAANLADTLRSEKVGGAILLVATVIALAWANIPGADYAAIRSTHVGIEALHLNLTVGQWASDGLLTVFFFVVGLELKREFTVGDLNTPAKGIIPIVGAIGGMAAPAAIFVIVNLALPNGALHGWAIPTATDIAFAVAILAVVNSHLPSALRAFLLTLAVVDDLLAITIIAIFYAHGFNLAALIAALGTIAVFGGLVQLRVRTPWLLVPIALIAWYFMHSSGVHATIAGVLLGFTVPALMNDTEKHSMAESFEHRLRPISTGFAVPVFALFAAGVSLAPQTFGAAVRDPVAIGVALGLLFGKPIGILGATYLTARFTRARLDEGLRWRDVVGVAAVGGIGFTVSLLIGELAFGDGSARDAHIKIAILIGSLLSALSGTAILWGRNRAYREIEERHERDAGAGPAGAEDGAEGELPDGGTRKGELPDGELPDGGTHKGELPDGASPGGAEPGPA